MDQTKIIELAINAGARDARLINAEEIHTAAWVAMKCRFGCGHYGKSLCCPPYAPTYLEMREVLREYAYAVLIQCNTLEETTPLALELERALFKQGYHKAIGLGAGKCELCADCTLEGCTHPGEARPSMEACGIDVMATAKASGIQIASFSNSDSTQAPVESDEELYFGYGLVLVD